MDESNELTYIAMGEHVGISDNAVRQLLINSYGSKSLAEKNKPKTMDAWRLWYCDRLRKGHINIELDGQEVDLKLEKAKLTKKQTEKIEFELLERSGKLISLNEMYEILSSIAQMFSDTLDRIPNKLKIEVKDVSLRCIEIITLVLDDCRKDIYDKLTKYDYRKHLYNKEGLLRLKYAEIPIIEKNSIPIESTENYKKHQKAKKLIKDKALDKFLGL